MTETTNPLAWPGDPRDTPTPRVSLENRPLTSAGDTRDTGDSSGDSPVPGPVPRRVSWNAVDLMATEFPPPRWAVPGLICEGITLLAGPPKVGKSWLSLGLGVAVASGGMALGAVHVHQGPVLYLALEDTARRLKSRLGKVLGDAPAPAGLTLVTQCPALTQGGDVLIAQWLDAHPGARLVVIDVFAKLRGTPPPGASAYDADYAAIGRIKRIADHYGVAVVLVHHVRKMASDDFLAEVSGTNGLAGAADAVLVLKRSRGEADAVLHITGRDVDESELATKFEPETGSWVLLDGPAVNHTVEPTRKALLEHLTDHPGSTPKQIAEGTGLDYELVKKTARRMVEDGQLDSAAGRYRLPGDSRDPLGPVPHVPAVPAAGQSPLFSGTPLSLSVPEPPAADQDAPTDTPKDPR